jgi:serine protease Do
VPIKTGHLEVLMKTVIERFRGVIIQIATPYSTGTGFYLRDANLIVTNEHVIQDNRQVVIDGHLIEKQLVRVIYSDPKHDLAFLEAPQQTDLPAVELGVNTRLSEGDPVLALGHPFGFKYTSTKGIISNTAHEINDINYYLIDAALNPGNSGGPLLNRDGAIIGINTFVVKDGNNIGFSLPVSYLVDSIKEFEKSDRQISVRCISCLNLVNEENIDGHYCPFCGTRVTLPTQTEDYEPIGVAHTIESILEQAGHEVELSRRGPNNWEIRQGSARITIAYYEKNGLITGDAYLATLPKKEIGPIYEFLLRQNYEVESLTFSVKEQDVILSLLIYDRYLNVDTGLKLFSHLFEKADHYDNILVEEYGAQWKYDGE